MQKTELCDLTSAVPYLRRVLNERYACNCSASVIRIHATEFIWIAISVYVLVTIIKKRHGLSTDLYTILQILSLTLFEKTPLEQLLANTDYKTEEPNMGNQLNLFEKLTGQ